MRGVRSIQKRLNDAGCNGFLPPHIQLRRACAEQIRFPKAEIQRHIQQTALLLDAELLLKRRALRRGRLCRFFFADKRSTDFKERLCKKDQRESRRGADNRFFQNGVSSFYFTGSCTVKVVPLFGSDATVTEPACSRTICLTMESPSPVPPVSRERALSTR